MDEVSWALIERNSKNELSPEEQELFNEMLKQPDFQEAVRHYKEVEATIKVKAHTDQIRDRLKKKGLLEEVEGEVLSQEPPNSGKIVSFSSEETSPKSLPAPDAQPTSKPWQWMLGAAAIITLLLATFFFWEYRADMDTASLQLTYSELGLQVGGARKSVKNSEIKPLGIYYQDSLLIDYQVIKQEQFASVLPRLETYKDSSDQLALWYLYMLHKEKKYEQVEKEALALKGRPLLSITLMTIEWIQVKNMLAAGGKEQEARLLLEKISRHPTHQYKKAAKELMEVLEL